MTQFDPSSLTEPEWLFSLAVNTDERSTYLTPGDPDSPSKQDSNTQPETDLKEGAI